MDKITHFLYVPWTGLGLYGGYRGDRWLKNRIKIFKQFVLESIKGQYDKDFVLWFSWRPEEKKNQIVRDFISYMKNTGIKTVNTFHGVCFWDDKYPDEEARARLLESLRSSCGELIDVIGESNWVYMTIQPSDDCYSRDLVSGMKKIFNETDVEAAGFANGYMIHYPTMRVAEYNPTTTPPFFTIKFPRETFIDPLKHAEYTGPYKSHEYISDRLKFGSIGQREFIVGTHGDNISTVFDHPFRGKELLGEEREVILDKFGLLGAEKLVVPFSIRRKIFGIMPYALKRKLRFLATEKKWILRSLFSLIYNFLRG
jgi:hypothetical protein